MLLDAFAARDYDSDCIADRWFSSARRYWPTCEQIPGRDEFDDLWTANLVSPAARSPRLHSDARIDSFGIPTCANFAWRPLTCRDFGGVAAAYRNGLSARVRCIPCGRFARSCRRTASLRGAVGAPERTSSAKLAAFGVAPNSAMASSQKPIVERCFIAIVSLGRLRGTWLTGGRRLVPLTQEQRLQGRYDDQQHDRADQHAAHNHRCKRSLHLAANTG